MRLFSLCLILFFANTTIFAINDIDPVGSRSAGMGRSGVAMPDIWSLHRNQAGLAYMQDISFGVFYENRYLTKELSSKSGAFIIPSKFGVFGMNVSQFGYELYNENKFGLAYARKFGEKIAVGLQLDYMHTHIAEEYGNKSLLTFEAGLIGQVTQNLYFGVHAFNPIQAQIAEYNNERMPAMMKMGLSYFFSKKVVVNADAEMDSENTLSFKTGAEYHITQPIYIRAGVATNPTINTLGFGFEYKKFKFDFSSSIHYVLGYSPQFSLIYSL